MQCLPKLLTSPNIRRVSCPKVKFNKTNILDRIISVLSELLPRHLKDARKALDAKPRVHGVI
jgi:hypothetical protein